MKQYLTKDICLILAAGFFFMASGMLVTPLITGFSETLGAGGAFMGFIGGLMNLCSLICRPVVGNLADSLSKYRFTLLGGIMMITAAAGYMFAPNTGVIVAARIISGVGFSCCSVCLSTWMSQLLPKEKVGSGMGLYGAMNALSMAVAPAIGISIKNRIGYRAAFFAALIFAAAILVCLFFIRDSGLPAGAKEPEKKAFAVLDVNAVPYALVILCFSIPYCATQSFLVRYVETRGLPVTVSLFFTIYAIFVLVLRMSLKSLFDKVRFLYFLIAGNISALLCMICLRDLHNMVLMTAASFFMAGGYGLMCSICQSHAILAAPDDRRGLANSTYYLGLDSGMAFGPMLGGLVYGSLPIEHFYSFFMVMVPLCLVLYFVSARLIQSIKTAGR